MMRKGMKMLIAALAVTGLLVASFAGIAMAAGPTDADADGICPYFGEIHGEGGMHGFHGEGTINADGDGAGPHFGEMHGQGGMHG